MNPIPSNIEIARQATMLPIGEVAAKAGVPGDHLEQYGKFKAKVSLDFCRQRVSAPAGKLILVTAISPTPAGDGKTTTTTTTTIIGLGDALNRIGKRAIMCLREPSLGPCFGMKGGAAGGGYAQVVPMEDINLHFTGDFHAIDAAHNLLSALLDNHLAQGKTIDRISGLNGSRNPCAQTLRRRGSFSAASPAGTGVSSTESAATCPAYFNRRL